MNIKRKKQIKKVNDNQKNFLYYKNISLQILFILNK